MKDTKMKLLFRNMFLMAVIGAGSLLTACDDNEPDNSVTVDLVYTEIAYNETGEWKECLNPEVGALVAQDVNFSHHAEVSQWGASWYGFCPSRSSDMADYSDGNWLDHQWSVMSGGGVAGVGAPYLIAYWSTMDGEDAGADGSLVITYGSNVPFSAESVYLNNTTYTYYAMKNGTSYSKKFGQGDWLKVIITGGTADGTQTESVEYYLADCRSEDKNAWVFVTDWAMVNLETLNANGPLTYISMRMESSDSGVWGMNTPSYFALDRLKIRL